MADDWQEPLLSAEGDQCLDPGSKDGIQQRQLFEEQFPELGLDGVGDVAV